MTSIIWLVVGGAMVEVVSFDAFVHDNRTTLTHIRKLLDQLSGQVYILVVIHCVKCATLIQLEVFHS